MECGKEMEGVVRDGGCGKEMEGVVRDGGCCKRWRVW